jgi:hypothetical protein
MYMSSYYKFIHINSPILVQRPLCLSLTLVLYHHPPTPKYCMKNSNYMWNVFFQLAQKKSISVRLLEDYSGEAHQSAIAFAIEFSTSHQEQEEQFDNLGSVSEDDNYGEIMNPTKVKIVSNDFLQTLPECPPIHWPSQMLNDPKVSFCPCSHITKPWRGKKKVSIHPNHGCKTKKMTPMQLLNHLEREGDSTHKAILVYLNQLATFQ